MHITNVHTNIENSIANHKNLSSKTQVHFSKISKHKRWNPKPHHGDKHPKHKKETRSPFILN
jgi:hypothetical protein